MRVPRVPHQWKISPERAVAIQAALATRVSKEWDKRPVRWVAGLDAAFSGSTCIAGVVLWDSRERKIAEEHVAWRTLTFPYIPGLLSFREAPALIAALRKLRRPPDLLICDGQGIAHPRRFGIASHVGVLTGLPSIGCAKSRLIGNAVEPGKQRGSTSPLIDRGEEIGAVLRTKTGSKPVYVSVGHMIDLKSAVEIVLALASGHRLPEPTRLADKLVALAKRDKM
ncbi:MAG: deoxyribonuclease V [Verrucomicrobiae bacterium]|nr:deoxyribonuclease V [Verrucomicrobiae bacterium]